MEASKPMTLEEVPNEALLKIFKHLDSNSLLSIMRVCHNWNLLANSEILWKKLCIRTERLAGIYTKEWSKEFTANRTWKQCYFWINKDDLKYTDPQELCDAATSQNSNPLRRKYLFSRGLDVFPESPLMLSQCADFLVDRPDVGDSWNLAQNFYQKALSMCEKDSSKYKKIMLFTIFRYAAFLANNRRDYNEADKYYRMLLRKLPGNSWVFEKYAEFLAEFVHKYNLAEKIYRVILNTSPTGSSLISYALFLWQVRRNYALAGKCFRVACELDMTKVYVYVNFLGRQVKDEQLGRDILLQSKLYKLVSGQPDDEQKVFSLALAFHQIHCVDEAEQLYRKHMTMTKNICTLSNLAELLLHSRLNFEEAESLYRRGLEMAGANDTIEVALGSLMLAQNNIKEGLEYMYRLVEMSHIKASRNAYTEAWIIILIHTTPSKKREALKVVKHQLVTEAVRPKLILMFDANLSWVKQQDQENYDWMKKLTDVYNCEVELEILNEWPLWVDTTVGPTVVDESDEELTSILNMDNAADQEEEEEDRPQQEDEEQPQTPMHTETNQETM